MLCFSSSQHLQVVESYVKHALMGHKSVLYSKRRCRFVIGGNTNAVDGCISTYWFMLHSGVVCVLYTRVPYQFESNRRQEVMPPLMDSLDDRRFPTLLESRSTETEKVSSIAHPDWTDEHSWTPKMLPWSHLSTERLGERVQELPVPGPEELPCALSPQHLWPAQKHEQSEVEHRSRGDFLEGLSSMVFFFF